MIKPNGTWYIHTSILLIISLLVWIVVNLYEVKQSVALVQQQQSESTRTQTNLSEQVRTLERQVYREPKTRN